MSESIRVRFAPSPTGPLHIGGVRTALYNFLFARKHGGNFVLRIEDTDQLRFVEGAEDYIVDSLQWLGLVPDEGVSKHGAYGPYRQSERRETYTDHVQKLVDSGDAYYAFDTPEELELMRQEESARGVHSPKYDQSIRTRMRNSLTLDDAAVSHLLAQNVPYTVRLRVPEGRVIVFTDVIRGEVRFATSELDDKVILKADGLPTYHLANVVDDRLMEISHVIRGEEWLSSTAHHVLLYEAFGWADEMPVFAHLPLILKPTGKGKLSKRDGAKFGFPVFPLDWWDDVEGVQYQGFREAGFLPEAVINFLSLLGWNPGTDREVFDLDALIAEFSLQQINKSGAQFDFDKAKWFNQQYLLNTPAEELYSLLNDEFTRTYKESLPQSDVIQIIELFKPRVDLIYDIVKKAAPFYRYPDQVDEKTLKKKYRSTNELHFTAIMSELRNVKDWNADLLSGLIKRHIGKNELKFGEVLPILRIWLTGEASGPDLFAYMQLLGRQKCLDRLENGLAQMDQIIGNA